jgi:hypothetical protein
MNKVKTYSEIKNQIYKTINKCKKNNKKNKELQVSNANNDKEIQELQLIGKKSISSELKECIKSINKINSKSTHSANSHYYSDIAHKARISNITTLMKNGRTKFALKDADSGLPSFAANSPFSLTLHKDREKINKMLLSKNPRKEGQIDNFLLATPEQRVEFERLTHIGVSIDNDSGLEPISDEYKGNVVITDDVEKYIHAKLKVVLSGFTSSLNNAYAVLEEGSLDLDKYPITTIVGFNLFIGEFINVYVMTDGGYASLSSHKRIRSNLKSFVSAFKDKDGDGVNALPSGLKWAFWALIDEFRVLAKENGRENLLSGHKDDHNPDMIAGWQDLLLKAPGSLFVQLIKVMTLIFSMEFAWCMNKMITKDGMKVEDLTADPATLYKKLRDSNYWRHQTLIGEFDSRYLHENFDGLINLCPIIMTSAAHLNLSSKPDITGDYDYSGLSYLKEWLSSVDGDPLPYYFIPDTYWALIACYIASDKDPASYEDFPGHITSLNRPLISQNSLSTISITKATTYAPKDLDQVTHINNGIQISFGDVQLFNNTLSNELTTDLSASEIIYPENTPDEVKAFIENNIGIDQTVDGLPIEDFKQVNSVGDLQLLIKQWYRQLPDRTHLTADSLIDYITKSTSASVFTLFGMGLAKFKTFIREIFAHMTSSDPELVNNMVSIKVDKVNVDPEPSSNKRSFSRVPSFPLAQFAEGEAITWDYTGLSHAMNNSFPCFVFSTLKEIADYKSDETTKTAIPYATKQLHTFETEGNKDETWFVDRFFSVRWVEKPSTGDPVKYTELASANFALNNIKVESPVFVQNVTYSNLLHLDLGKSQFSKDLAAFIKELFSSETNGADALDVLDQFLASANGTISANISSLLSYLSQFWDRINDSIDTKYTGDLQTYMYNAVKFLRSRYSDTGLDFISHVFSQFYDNFSSPAAILSEFKSDLLSLFDAHKDDISIPDPIMLESLISLLYEQLFGDFTAIIAQIESIALNPIAKATKTITTLLTQGSDEISQLMSQVGNITAQIQQNISSFDFWSLDQFDKLNNFDLMDIINVFNKLYRVLAQKAVNGFKQFVSILTSLPLPEQIERFTLVFKGYISSVFSGIAKGLDSKAAAMTQYLNDLIPNMVKQIPQIISNIATFAVDMAASLVSHAIKMVQGIFNLASDFTIDTSSAITIDNLDGESLWTYDLSDKSVLLNSLRDLNLGVDYAVVIQDASKSVLYILDTGLGKFETYADAVDGKLKHCLSFINASKYKAYESIARTMPQINSESLQKELKALSTAEEVIRTLSVLDQGPSWARALSPIHWALTAAQNVVDDIGQELIDEISSNIPLHLADSFQSDSFDDALIKIATLATSAGGTGTFSDNSGSNKAALGLTIEMKPVAFLPAFRVRKKGSMEKLVDSVLLVGMAALLAVCVATGGAAISVAINGIAKGLSSVTRLAYKRHQNHKFLSAIDKEIGSRKNVDDSLNDTINRSDSQQQYYLNSLPQIED